MTKPENSRLLKQLFQGKAPFQGSMIPISKVGQAIHIMEIEEILNNNNKMEIFIIIGNKKILDLVVFIIKGKREGAMPMNIDKKNGIF
jgi:hypothetical protein